MKRIFKVLISISLFSLFACKGMESETYSENNDLSEKRSILSVSIFGDSYEIDDIITLFINVNPNVEIEVNNFPMKAASYEEDSEKYVTQTITKLMAGIPDDIIDATGLPHLQLSEGGYLSDFYTLMEKDNEFHKEDYYFNVFSAMNYRDKLHVFPLNFTYRMVGVNIHLSDQLSVDFSQHETITDRDLLDLYKLHNPSSFYLEENFNPIGAVADNIDRFIDYESKKCNFDSEEFINIINDAKQASELTSGQAGIQYNSRSGINPNIESAKKYMFKKQYPNNYEYFLPYKEFNDFINFIPISNSDDKVYIYPLNRYCISEQSDNKDLSWEFLKFCTLPETNNKTNYSVNKTTFEQQISSSMRRLIAEFESEGFFLEDDIDENIKNVLSQLNEYNQMPMYYASHENYLKFIYDDMELFINNIMTAEQVADDLQNKISLALTE